MANAGSPPKGGFWSQSALLMAANGLAAVLAAAYASLSGRLLGPEGYGPVAASLALAGLLALISGPLETGINKLAADFHGQGERGQLAALTFGSLRRLVIPVGVGMALWLSLSPIMRQALRFEGFGELAVLALYGAFSMLALVPRGVQRGDHRFLAYGLNLVFEAAARLACGAAAMLLGLGAAGTVGGYAAGMAAALGLGLWQLRDLKSAPPAPARAEHVYAFSLPLFIVYFYFLFVVSADVLVAKRVLPPAEAGIYGACNQLTRLLYLAATPIYQVLFSRVATARAQGMPTGRLKGSVTAAVAAALAVSNLAPLAVGCRASGPGVRRKIRGRSTGAAHPVGDDLTARAGGHRDVRAARGGAHPWLLDVSATVRACWLVCCGNSTAVRSRWPTTVSPRSPVACSWWPA